MSITRAQIAKQLLNSIAPKGEKLAYINKKEAKLLKKKGGAGIDVNGTGIRSYFDPGVGAGSVSESLSEAAGVGSGYSGGNSGDSGSRGNFATITRGPRTVSPTRDEAIQNPFGRTRVNRNFISPKAAVNKRPPPDYLDDEKKETLLDKGIGYGKNLAKTYAKNTALTALGISNPFGLTAMALTSLFNRAKEDKAKRDSIDAKTANARLSGSFTTAFNPTRTTGPGPTIDGGDNMPMPMMPFRSPELPSDIESKPSDFDLYAALEGRENMNFGMNPNNMTGAMQRFSDGGEVRQRYGLGSFVKSIGRSVKKGVKKGISGIKKFAKSDLGKAALLYATGTYLGGTTAFGGSGIGGKAGLKKFGFENFGKRLFSPTGANGFSNIFNPLRAGQPGTFKLPFIGSGETELTEAQKVLLNKKKTELTVQDMLDIKKIPGIGDSKTSALAKYGIPAAMAASYLFTKNEEPDNLDEEMMKNYKDTSGLKEQIASYPEFRFQVPEAYRLADGGRIGYDMGGDVEMASYGYDDAMNETRELFMQYKKSGIVPMEMEFEEFLELLQGSKQKEEPNRVMAQEGGIMNLGGLEKDYREGGFVPIGVQEKADDVPARLSKNEFVFTADAVRAAGGGSVDKGADLMYKTMKNLESRVG